MSVKREERCCHAVAGIAKFWGTNYKTSIPEEITVEIDEKERVTGVACRRHYIDSCDLPRCRLTEEERRTLAEFEDTRVTQIEDGHCVYKFAEELDLE